jgi:hypothetical protein
VRDKDGARPRMADFVPRPTLRVTIEAPGGEIEKLVALVTIEDVGGLRRCAR